MPIELKIPNIGESISEVQIAEWLKADGDEVKKDENIAMIDSEKTTLELPSPESGRLKILHPAGDTVKIGEIVARIETNGAPGKSKTGEAETAKAESGKRKAETESKRPEKKEPPKKVTEPQKEKSPKPENEQPEQEPEAVEQKPGVQEAKTEREVSPPPAAKTIVGREEEVIPMTMLRRTAAKRLVEAKQQMAMLTTFNEVDMSVARALREANQEAFQERYQVKLGFMSFFVKAVIDALKQFPQLNAEIRGNDVVYRNYFDIGVAIASGRGLVVPVLRSAERMSFAEIERAIADFARRAKDGKLKPDELEGGTFTLTNGGVFGSLLSTPIVNPPQTGILGMHAIQERPIALQGQVVIHPMMFLALTYDHRIVDGREAVLFLRRVKEAVENPARMLIEV
ncbi:MAG TPA: 2-oxoglutarate dehydrogenase complex dihydrolipoyllysine-residue succinyltransferase [Candidatus Aquilonibacter sp.]|nr:2-oxoglutarate dehydrogenase complex dihydrolipoyllysine-residue succinyltransferase [Candidatus Aquilonibacter sp.]